jgi:hypothetical protein
MAFNPPFKNISVISWRSVLLVEETGDKQFVCYDVTITTVLLSRLHLQKQAFRLNITSDNNL